MGRRASQLQIIELLEVWSSARPSESWHGEAPEHLSLSNNRGHNARAKPSHEHKQKSGLTAAEEERKKFITLSSGLAIDLIGGTIVEQLRRCQTCLRHARQGLSGLGGVERAFRETGFRL